MHRKLSECILFAGILLCLFTSLLHFINTNRYAKRKIGFLPYFRVCPLHFLTGFFYLSYPLNPRHFHSVNSNLGFLHLLCSYKVKIGYPYNSHGVIEYPKMLYFKTFLYLLLYLSHQYYRLHMARHREHIHRLRHQRLIPALIHKRQITRQ